MGSGTAAVFSAVLPRRLAPAPLTSVKEGRFGCLWPNVKITQGSVDQRWGE